jgi:hypothetical protein
MITITPLELILTVLIAGLLNSINAALYGVNAGLFMGLVIILAPRNRYFVHNLPGVCNETVF